MRNRWRLLRMALAAVAIAVAAVMNAWTPAAALECEGVVLDDGCLFTVTGGDTPDPDDGYAVTNAHGAPFYDFVRARDLQSIGYPISQRWATKVFTLQAFQKVILQWDPGAGRMYYYNTLDELAKRYPELQLPNVPPHQVLGTDADADFATVLRAHLALLDANAAIKERFLREPAWLDLYGLPIRYQEQEVDGHPQGLQLLRTQRTVFEIWNVPAPGTVMGQVNLQNVPDRVKQFDNVIIPNSAKALRKASDPDYPAIITSLNWVADGLTPLEQEGVDHLERIFAVSEPFLRFLAHRIYNWNIRDQPSQSTVFSFRATARHAEQPWFRDGINPTEQSLFGEWGTNATDVPDLAELVLQKHWIKDGVTNEEVDIVHGLLNVGVNERMALKETNPGSDEPTIAYYLLRMPFLESIEPFDLPAILSLYRVGWLHRHEQHTIVAHYVEQGGITDDHAKIIPVLARVVERKPELLSTILDPASVSLEERSIVLPYTGPVILAVIRTRPGDAATLAHLEEAVRFSEGFMKRPFPTRYIAMHVTEAIEPWGGLFLGTHFAIREGYDDREHYFNKDVRSVIHHEVAHYFWHSCPSWLCEGTAVYFEIKAGVVGLGAREDLAHDCRSDSLRDVTSELNTCHTYLGSELFLNLYHSLGEEVFVRGLGRLYESLEGNLSPGSCEGVETGLCHLRFAYVTDAAPEAAALAERVIRKWYFREN